MLFDDDEKETAAEKIWELIGFAWVTSSLLLVSLVVALAYLIYYVIL